MHNTTQESGSLTGRISKSPSELMHELILQPQFDYEMKHLLPFYIWIEKAMLLEYRRMGLIKQAEVEEIANVLSQINIESLLAKREYNMSDIAFAIEKWVEKHTEKLPVAWHLDRSRNDFQATAQLMFGRQCLMNTIKQMLELVETLHRVADRYMDTPMPGYTHYQSAQVITPGFYMLAIAENVLAAVERMQFLYAGINRSPLGSGAMAGQELNWNREELAVQLGFDAPVRHALLGVASRDWTLQIGAELSSFSVMLSRFMTDLICWGSSEYGFIELPDELSGISSSMPQKKNFPVLERLRAKTAHVSAFYTDFVMAQRSTAYTNLVETSKEAGSHFATQYQTMNDVLVLLDHVLQHVVFKEQSMLDACKKEYLGGFTMANLLTLEYGVPTRQAQVMAGRYIMERIEHKKLPDDIAEEVLITIGEQAGYNLTGCRTLLEKAFDIEQNLQMKCSDGGTSPQSMRRLLGQQREQLKLLIVTYQQYGSQLQQANEQTTVNLYKLYNKATTS